MWVDSGMKLVLRLDSLGQVKGVPLLVMELHELDLVLDYDNAQLACI